MDSPEETCVSVKEITSKQNDVISQQEIALSDKHSKVTKIESQPQKTNVVERLCEYYFASLKFELFLSSLYLVIVSNVVLFIVILALAKVIASLNSHKS